MAKVCILGAGAMGLSAAFHAARQGHEVVVFEPDDRPGGQAAHFDFDGSSVERFYHFICRADRSTFELLEELGIAERLEWRQTTMGYFVGGELHPWGDPLSLLRFPLLGPVDKLRYGLTLLLATLRRDGSALDRVTAADWLRSRMGKRAFDLLWQRLLSLKFHQHAEEISAAWMWTRIKRVATSRTNPFQETLGFLDGGSQVLVDALVEEIEGRGGSIRLRCPVTQVVVRDQRVVGVETPQGTEACDWTICTVPIPYVSKLIPDLSDTEKMSYDAIDNIGVVCVVLKLDRSVSQHFWVNIVEPEIPLPGIIEFSRLRALPATLVYAPYYLPSDSEQARLDDDAFVAATLDALSRLNPEISKSNLIASSVARLNHAQPVCPPGFRSRLPPIETSIGGLLVADTSYYYPEDRGISESVRLGKWMADRLDVAELSERGGGVASGSERPLP